MATNFFTLSSEGNFRTFDSFNSWLSQLINLRSASDNLNGATVEVRGNNVISSSLLIENSIDVLFIGNSGTLTFNAPCSISNITFKNLDIVINSTITILSFISFEDCTITINSDIGINLGPNTVIKNCQILYNYDATSDGSFNSVNLANNSKAAIFGSTASNLTKIFNVLIDNCHFSTGEQNHFSFISFLVNDESHNLENININNNRFTTSFSDEDKRSIISFISTILTIPTLPQGPRITNININKNICDKNQLIIISATLNGSNIVANLLVPINVNIDNNICGAIGFLMKQDTSLSITNTTNINDKTNTLLIYNNTCKFIYCCFSNGLADLLGVLHTGKIITGNHIYSSSVIIEKNKCSWINIGIKSPSNDPTYENSNLTIINNKLNAYNLNYLNDYFNTFAPVQRAIYLSRQGGD